MKISKLIQQLQEAQALIGDVPVRMASETNPRSVLLEIPVRVVTMRGGMQPCAVLSEAGI